MPPDNPPIPCSDCSISDLTPPLNDPLAGRIEGCSDGLIPDPAKCVLGYAVGAKATIAIFGDSHAASWTPAIERLALINDWRVLDLTRGGCPSVATAVWNADLKREDTECDAWRESVFARLAVERPTLIIIANTGQYSLMSGGDRIDHQQNTPSSRWAELWSTGLEKMLTRLAPLQSTLVVIGDVPTPSHGGSDPLTCIAQHATDFQVCRASRDLVVPTPVHDLEKALAVAHGAVYVDPTSWLCDTDSCPAVIAHYVVYSDASGHLTAPFTLSLAGRLLAAVPFPK